MIPVAVMQAAAAADPATLEQLGQFGLAGLLAFVLMYAINRLVPARRFEGLSEQDRALLQQILTNSHEQLIILKRISQVVDAYLMQQA
jgi:hypothetical protein